MRTISAKKIEEAIADLCVQANTGLRKDVLVLLKSAHLKEANKSARAVLSAIIENASIAKNDRLAICQDTGMPVVFLELGQGLSIKGGLKKAVNNGVSSGYRNGYLRNSIIQDPLKRGNPKFYPALLHIDIVKGDKLKVTVLPKGFGCENKAQLKMFNPTAGIEEIKKFIVEVVKSAGPDACPPYVVGVGIGGTADYAMYLAKKALLRKVKSQKSKVKSESQKSKLNYLERELLREINKLNIGPMGLGGKNTALAVNIETYPTHIAGLPVAVNISCHALRSATKIL